MSAFVFDRKRVEENSGDFPPIPAGDYPCVISGTNYMTSKKGSPMVVLTFEILGDNNGGRLHFEYYVVDMDIGYAKLGQLVFTLGLESISLPERATGSKEDPIIIPELQDKRIGLTLTCKPDKEGKNRNNIKKYFAIAQPQTGASEDDVPW